MKRVDRAGVPQLVESRGDILVRSMPVFIEELRQRLGDVGRQAEMKREVHAERHIGPALVAKGRVEDVEHDRGFVSGIHRKTAKKSALSILWSVRSRIAFC